MKHLTFDVRPFGCLLFGAMFFASSVGAQEVEVETQGEVTEQLNCEEDVAEPIELPEMPLLDSDEEKQLVVDALRWRQEVAYPICAYSVRTTMPDRPVLVERFTPSEGYDGTWSAISVGNQPPTVEFLEQYEHRGEQIYPPIPYNDYVELNSLARVSQTESEITFASGSTQEMAREDPRMERMVHLIDVKLVIDEDSRSLKNIEFNLREPYKPNIFFRMSAFNQKHGLEYDRVVGDRIITSFKMLMNARIIGLRRVNLDLDVEIFDFHCPLEIQPREVLCKYQRLESQMLLDNEIEPNTGQPSYETDVRQ